MMKQGEVFEGKSLDDAVRKGLETLGLNRAEAMITVIDEGSGGFLGLGAKPYRVRIMPRPGGPPRDSGDGDGRPRRGGRSERGGSDRNGGRHGRASQGSPRRDDRGKGGDSRRDQRPASRPAVAAPREDAPVASERDDRGGRPADRGDRNDRGDRGRRRGRRGGSGERRESAAVAERPETQAPRYDDQPVAGQFEPADRDDRPAVAERYDDRPERRERPASTGVAELTPAELEAAGRQFLNDLLKLMRFEGTVEAKADGTRLETRLSIADGEELLTGRKGEVRQAIQHLLTRALNRGAGARYHVQVEINDFWANREQELQQLARDLAEEALSKQSEAITEYLNAQERRIIHVTLREDTRVKTYALGTGMIKRVAIAPADFAGGGESGD